MLYSSNILILTYWPFDDALIQAYTLPYVRIIRKYLSPDKEIWLQTLEQKSPSIDKISSIHASLSSSKINWYPRLHHKSVLRSALENAIQLLKYIYFCRQHNIKVIHILCTPPGILGYILSVLINADLIIDSYEPHAETMAENGSWNRNSFKFFVLFFFEKLMSRRAKVLIAATYSMLNYSYNKYGVNPTRFYVKPACVDTNLFSLNNRRPEKLALELGLNNKIVLVYAGKFGGNYLDIEVFAFLKVAYGFYGNRLRVLLLTSHKREEIEYFCNVVDLPSDIVVSRFVSHSLIPAYIGLADFAITPVKPIPTNLFCTPAKNGEYWAMGLPIVITPGISDDSSIIKMHNIGAVLDKLDHNSYLSAVHQIDRLLNSDQITLAARIRDIALKYRSFAIAHKVYSELYY